MDRVGKVRAILIEEKYKQYQGAAWSGGTFGGMGISKCKKYRFLGLPIGIECKATMICPENDELIPWKTGFKSLFSKQGNGGFSGINRFVGLMPFRLE